MQLKEIINYLQETNAKLGKEVSQLSAELKARQIMPEEFWNESQKLERMKQKHALALSIINYLVELQALKGQEGSFDFRLLMTNTSKLVEAHENSRKHPRNAYYLERLHKAISPIKKQLQKAKDLQLIQPKLF